MAVPFPLIFGAVAVVVVVLILFYIIYKILKKKRNANEESAGNGSKNRDYEKLEEGEDELEAETDPDDPTGTRNTKSKKRKQKRKRKAKGLSDGAEDTEDGANTEDETLNGVPAAQQQVGIARLQISVAYVPSSRQISVTIHQGENLPSNNLTTAFEVRITLLPAKVERFKTKSVPSVNPMFDELFTFWDVFPENIQTGAFRARVYKLKARKRALVGEIRCELSADLGLERQNVEYLWREITPAREILDDISDTVIVTDPEKVLMAPKETVPMLLVSLQHKCVTGKLTVEIIKARHMKTISTQKAPETFVQIALVNSNGVEIANAKTALCKGNFHPVFEETFYFTAIEFELPNLTVAISVFCKKFRSKELVGQFSLGRESTGEREQLHWNEMIDAKGEPIKGWYTLGQE